MKKSLINKFTLKILSLFIAIFIWLIVMNIQHPVISKNFYNIPVTFINESYIERTNSIPLMVEGKDKVNIQIKGDRSVIDNLSEDDISAVADLTQIVNMKTDPIMVPVTVSLPGVSGKNISSISSTPGNIPIKIEESATKEFTIAVNTGDTKPGKGYEIGNEPQVNPEKITIMGPKSIVEKKIDKVVAQVDVDGMTKSEVRQAQLKIYDKNQDEFAEKQMSSLKFQINNQAMNAQTVDVQIDLWKIVSDIPVDVEYSGTPLSGFVVGSAISTPQTISVAGTDQALSEFAANGNKLVIPAESIDVTGKSGDYEVKVDLTDFLPEDMKLATDVSSSALVTVKILPLNSKDFEFSVSDITVNNKPENSDVVFGTDKVTVRVQGTREDMEKLDKSQVKLSIDLKAYAEGEYEVPVKIEVPEGYQSVDTVKVKLKLVKAAELAKGSKVPAFENE